MTIKQQLFNSFIKRIGKTVGTAMVFGFIGTVFYMYSNTKLYINKETTNTQTDIQISDVHKDTTDDVETDNVETDNAETDNNLTNHTKTNYEDLENVVNSKYKNLFENLMK